MNRTLPLIAALAALAATPAAADYCCECAVGCPPVVVLEQGYVPPYFIVNRGPVYSGPGINVGPWVRPFYKPIADYPYVDHDYPYYRGYYGRVHVPRYHGHYRKRHLSYK
jgi:hypothetical protein